MNKGMNPVESNALGFLESWGFNVVRLETSRERTADFLVSDSLTSYVIEVTEKKPMKDFKELLASSTEKGFSSISRDTGPSMKLVGKIRDKDSQLRRTRIDENAHMLLWIACLHGDAPYFSKLLLGTLYGVVPLITFKRGTSDSTCKDCLYYDKFTFFNTPGLAGVFFAQSDGHSLLANSRYSRIDQFRDTQLYRFFKDGEGLLDPELNEKCLVLDPSVDRDSEEPKRAYLRKRYGLETKRMMQRQFMGIGSISLPVTNLDGD